MKNNFNYGNKDNQKILIKNHGKPLHSEFSANHSSVIHPCATALTTISIAFFAPNLLISLLRNVSTVFSEIFNKSAISWVFIPLATASNTSRSRRVGASLGCKPCRCRVQFLRDSSKPWTSIRFSPQHTTNSCH